MTIRRWAFAALLALAGCFESTATASDTPETQVHETWTGEYAEFPIHVLWVKTTYGWVECAMLFSGLPETGGLTCNWDRPHYEVPE